MLARAVAERAGLDHIDLAVFKVDMAAANVISSAKAKRYEAVPVAFDDETTLRRRDGRPRQRHGDRRHRPDHRLRRPARGRHARGHRAADQPPDAPRRRRPGRRARGGGGRPDAEVIELRESGDEAPVIKLVNQIIAQAVEVGASDVHLAPDGKELRVRFRVDGVLQETTTIPKRMVAGAISRVKIMSDLDIAERRVPQDGRVGLTIDGKHIDLRVVTLPSVHGESVVDPHPRPGRRRRPRPRRARLPQGGARRASSARSTSPTAPCS